SGVAGRRRATRPGSASTAEHPLEPPRGGGVPGIREAVAEPRAGDAGEPQGDGPRSASRAPPRDRSRPPRPSRAGAAAGGGLSAVPPATGTRLLTLAFDPDVQPAGDALSERILDAALELAAASGLRRLTMDDVARRAGVGRMTVYRRFGGHGKLIDALAVRECRRCLERIAAALDPRKPMDE